MCFCSAACFFVSQTISNSIHDLVFCLPIDMERGLPPQQDPPAIRNVRYVKSQCEARAGAKSPITLYLHTFRLAYHSRPQTLRSRCPSCEKENSSGFEDVSVFSPTELKLVWTSAEERWVWREVFPSLLLYWVFSYFLAPNAPHPWRERKWLPFGLQYTWVSPMVYHLTTKT